MSAAPSDPFEAATAPPAPPELATVAAVAAGHASTPAGEAGAAGHAHDAPADAAHARPPPVAKPAAEADRPPADAARGAGDAPGGPARDAAEAAGGDAGVQRTHGPSTSYSFTASTLRQRHVPLRETVLPRPSSGFSQSPGTGGGSASNGAPGPSGTKPAATASAAGADGDEGGLFECNICLDMASNPVVTLCGHLFCWPCIHKWLTSRLPASNTCPVCKAGLDKDKVIPIYVRGREAKDPRAETEVPSRPAGQRTEPTPSGGGWDFGGMFAPGGANFGNVQIGFGMFPFGLTLRMGGNGNAPHGRPAGGQQPQQQATAPAQQVQEFVSRMFLMLATLALVSIIMYT